MAAKVFMKQHCSRLCVMTLQLGMDGCHWSHSSADITQMTQLTQSSEEALPLQHVHVNCFKKLWSRFMDQHGNQPAVQRRSDLDVHLVHRTLQAQGRVALEASLI